MARTGQIKNLVSSVWTTKLNLFQPDTAPGASLVWPVFDFSWDGLDLGNVTKERQLASSFYVDGAFQLASRRPIVNYKMQFRVTGLDLSTLETNIAALVAAVTAPSWQLWVQPDGVSGWGWSCYDSEIQVGLSASHWAGVWAPVVASGLRQPVPLAGVY